MKIYNICFSPTGGTKKAADAVSKALDNNYEFVDLTSNSFSCNLTKDDVAVISVPSYGGRVPEIATKRIASLKGNGAKAVLICVYGNRDYDDTLVELQDTAAGAGFNVFAGIAAIAEHSIARQYAAGRPDKNDEKTLIEFAQKIKQKLESGNSNNLEFKGNRPYKKISNAAMIPKPTSKCTKCGLCAEKCPVGAIDLSNPKNVDSSKCISCMRCVSICPQGSRNINKVLLFGVSLALKSACSNHKDYELII